MQTLTQVAGFVAQNAPQIMDTVNTVMQANNAIQAAQSALSTQNNQNVTDVRSGGELSATQGHKVPPIYF
jgi:hypothetical protein